MELTASGRRYTGRHDTDGMAVTSFVLGLIGLLVMNVFLGPVALVLAILALRRGTTRRPRALAGLALGIADLVIFAALIAAENAHLTPGA